eukprot:9954993-Lingulodinium_polyedra.AAC.1
MAACATTPATLFTVQRQDAELFLLSFELPRLGFDPAELQLLLNGALFEGGNVGLLGIDRCLEADGRLPLRCD